MRKTHWFGGALVFILASFLAFTSCEKPITATDASQEVSFELNNIMFGKKDVNPNDPTIPVCSDEDADFVRVLIGSSLNPSGTWYILDLLALEDGTVTEVLQLPADDYSVLEFLVYNDETGDGYSMDDVIIYASPNEGSYYDNIFNFEFNVEQDFELLPFEKEQNVIDVLCYTPAEYKKFGFKHFKFHPYEVHEICFFGDVCSKFWEDWKTYEGNNNPYFGWPEHYDMYGVFSVTGAGVDAQGNPMQIYASNKDVKIDLGSSSFVPEDLVVCIEFLDDALVDGEEWSFDIYAMLPDGDSTLVGTSVVNDMPADADYWGNFGGEDGILTWVLGDCNFPENEIEMEGPAVLFLPETGRIDIENTNHAGALYDYFDVRLLGTTWDASPLYPEELTENALLPGWCGDLYTGISEGEYNVNVYSSLKPWLMPSTPTNGQGMALSEYPWETLNWIANQAEYIVSHSDDAKEVQAILWILIHGDSPSVLANIDSQLGYNFVADHGSVLSAQAAATQSAGFAPRTGDWSVVVFTPYRGDSSKLNWYQFVLVRVDP